MVLPPVTVTPAALSFEDMPVSRPDYDVATLSKFVWVRHGVGGGLELKKLSATLPFIKVKIESVSGGGQAHLLRVGFTDKPAAGRHAGALRIETNNQEVPVIEIPLDSHCQIGMPGAPALGCGYFRGWAMMALCPGAARLALRPRKH